MHRVPDIRQVHDLQVAVLDANAILIVAIGTEPARNSDNPARSNNIGLTIRAQQASPPHRDDTDTGLTMRWRGSKRILTPPSAVGVSLAHARAMNSARSRVNRGLRIIRVLDQLRHGAVVGPLGRIDQLLQPAPITLRRLLGASSRGNPTASRLTSQASRSGRIPAYMAGDVASHAVRDRRERGCVARGRRNSASRSAK